MDIAKWIIVSLSIGGLIFNSGILYNHVHNLTKIVEELKKTCIRLDEKIDNILIILAKEKEN